MPLIDTQQPRSPVTLDRYQTVRSTTERLCQPLATEDYVIQSMPDASPAKWHLAHTSWFFESLILRPAIPHYRSFHPQFDYLFNSYYLSLGPRHCRPKRGLLSRPTVAEVYQYRRHVDQHMNALLDNPELHPVIEIGLHHEQQHQELILTDVKHLFGSNPLHPVYHPAPVPPVAADAPPARWLPFPGGLLPIGHQGPSFAYDNESPRHPVYLEPFQLRSRLVSCGEYLAFMQDGGYQRGELWLSDGWNHVQSHQWTAPLYWENHDDQWQIMTLAGLRPLNPAEPVCHVSYYEADAYARWAGVRLPTEAEWETASQHAPLAGPFLEQNVYHPRIAPDAQTRLTQMFGDLWQWTASAYLPYPGYQPAPGALSEYNGKFMCNQFVLRGGSCATPQSHIRRTYRNFFPPEARWQFTGIRLARQ